MKAFEKKLDFLGDMSPKHWPPPPLRGLGDKQNFKNTVFSFFKYFIITCTQNSCDKTEKMVLIKKKFQDMLYIYILSEKVDFLGRRGVEPPPPW